MDMIRPNQSEASSYLEEDDILPGNSRIEKYGMARCPGQSDQDFHIARIT
jgi:hypothetical protein